jgi:hypothetical protein
MMTRCLQHGTQGTYLATSSHSHAILHTHTHTHTHTSRERAVSSTPARSCKSNLNPKP